MDITDFASEAEEKFLEHSIAMQLAEQAGGSGVSATHCEYCGEAIPEARRVAVPGVVLCVPCKQYVERMGGR